MRLLYNLLAFLMAHFLLFVADLFASKLLLAIIFLNEVLILVETLTK